MARHDARNFHLSHCSNLRSHFYQPLRETSKRSEFVTMNTGLIFPLTGQHLNRWAVTGSSLVQPCIVCLANAPSEIISNTDGSVSWNFPPTCQIGVFPRYVNILQHSDWVTNPHNGGIDIGAFYQYRSTSGSIYWQSVRFELDFVDGSSRKTIPA